MKTDHKIITGILLLTLVIIIGGTWLSSKKGINTQTKLSKPFESLCPEYPVIVTIWARTITSSPVMRTVLTPS